jgi:hypothetical protein
MVHEKVMRSKDTPFSLTSIHFTTPIASHLSAAIDTCTLPMDPSQYSTMSQRSGVMENVHPVLRMMLTILSPDKVTSKVGSSDIGVHAQRE